MAFHIRNEQADQLLRELQSLTGESLTEAVAKALQERLDREKLRVAASEATEDPLVALQEVWSRLENVKVLDTRPDNEIIGYGPDGLPA